MDRKDFEVFKDNILILDGATGQSFKRGECPREFALRCG